MPAKLKILLFVFIVAMTACKNTSEKKQKEPSLTGHTTLLEKSTRSTAQGFREPGNWCFNRFPDAIPVDVPPQNSNERDFNIPLGVSKIVVDFGKITSSFLLFHIQGKGIELFTSNHFAQCLSNDEHFKLYPAGNGFRYNNNHEIQYELEILPYSNGYRAKMTFPVASQYGIAVHHCSDCAVE
ncbi:MAG: hypothetical protein IPL65_03640 [Lewinellaceae bacterium]|nr:hypothetical protein [Lewinellaceae bacterium]